MFRMIFLILSGNAFGSLILLARNLAVARLVSVEDYGIAATFAVSMSVVEMVAGLGLQQLIVQDKTGNDPHLQAGLQGFNLLRSLFSGLLLFLLAAPIAHFLGIPEVTWAYQVLALIPVLRGFEHFDIYRLNRKMVYRPLILTKTVPALVSVLSIWPLYVAYGDYRVMLYAVMIQWTLAVLVSNLTAERRFQLAFNRQVMLRGLKFGWPLLINNILLFAVFQGDKLIVGRELGMTDLAIFSMGITLSLTPTLVSAASEQQFFLPQLSAVEEPSDFRLLATAAMQTSLISGLALVAAMMLLGEPLIHLLLGVKYEPLIPLLTWFAILQAVRVFKVGGTIAALSRAQTTNALLANCIRILALPAAWLVAANGGSLLQIIWVATAGEAGAYIMSLLLVRVRLGLDLRRMVLPLLAAAALLVTAALHTSLSSYPGYSVAWSAIAFVVLFLAMLASMQELRSYIGLRTLTRRVE